MEVVRGPMTETDRFESMLGFVEKRLWGGRSGRHTVLIGIDWPDPATGYRIVQTAQQNFFEQRHASEIALIGESISIIEGHVSSAQASIQEALGQINAALPTKSARPVPAPTFVSSGPVALPAGVVAMQSELRTMQQTITDISTSRSQRLTAAQARLTELRGQYGSAHPDVAAAEENIRALEQPSAQLADLRAKEATLIQKLGPNLNRTSLGTSEPSLAREALQALTRASPDSQERPEVTFAKSRLKIATTAYEDQLDRLEGAKIELETARAAFKYRYNIITPARIPKEAEKPRIPLLIIGGTILAVLATLFTVVMLDFGSGSRARAVAGGPPARPAGAGRGAATVSAPTVGPVPMAAPSATERPAKPLAGPWLIAFISAVVLSLAVLLVTSGNPVIAGIPLMVVAVVYLFTALPLRVPMFTLLFLACLSDSLPIAIPVAASGGVEVIGTSTEIVNGVDWAPPQYPLYKVIFDNLNNVLPIEALRFSATDVLYVLSLLLILMRVAFRIRVDRIGREPATTALHLVMGGVLLAAIWLEVWGVGLRGGDFRQSLWQFRHLFWLPTLTLLFVYSLRDVRDFNRAINLVIAAVCIKLVAVVWFYFTVARPAHFEPATLTSHYDSILFTLTIVALVTRYLHDMSTKNLVLLVGIGLWVMLGIVLNNRRLAFVSLGASLFVVFVMLRGPVKRLLVRLMLYAAPLAVVYVVVGQAGNSRIFKPAKLVTSVIKQDDRSSSTRDIENYNLLVTLKRSKVLGSGWGHEYVEDVKADDISAAFPQYRYMAHNSVLWLWTIGGLVGFTLLWMPLSLGIFMARRAYTFSRSPEDRTAAAVCLTMVIIYMIQAWGDLGTQHLNSSLILAVSLATSAKLVVRSGAMPARMRFFAVRRPDARVQAQAHVAFTPGAP